MPSNWALTYSDYFVYDSASNYYKHNTNPDWNVVAGTVYEQGSTAYYRDRYMMVYVAANGGSVSVNAGNVYDFLLGDTATVSLTQGLHVLRITGAATTVTFNYASPTIPLNFTISNTRTTVGINPLLGKNMDSPTNGILKYIRDNLSTQFSKFFVNHYLDEAKQIELSTIYPMDSAQAFYDYNNVANRWVISEIDFKKSDIKIAKSSTK